MVLIIGLGIVLIAFFPANPVMAESDSPEIGKAISESQPQSEDYLSGSERDFTGCTRINSAPLNADFEQRVVELVNLERAKVGAAPLKRNSDLDFASRYHARDMVDDQYDSLTHDTMDRVDGSLIKVCDFSTRIRLYYTDYYAAGENLAAGFDTPEDVVKGWMGSEGHRNNMLDPRYREIGVGFYKGDALFREYWVMDLVGKSDVYPVIINNEVAQTTSPYVNLFVYGKDKWSEMRVNNNNSSWSTWMPFQETVNWQLNPVNGIHTLSVELREAGQTTAGAVSSDSITLTVYTLIDLPIKVFLPTIVR